jgi:hypothetical protein
MTSAVFRILAAAVIGLALAGLSLSAHHEILGKFDEGRRMTLSGIVTLVDWRNPHVHVFVNVRDDRRNDVNWAVELESPIDLQRSGWNAQSVRPGDAVRVEGMAARDGSRQVWGTSMVLAATGRQVLNATPRTPSPMSGKPTPRWADGRPRLGALTRTAGYWSFPSSPGLVENGVTAAMNAHGLLRNIADAPKVAPLQRWAVALYMERQRRFLRDDPGYLHCKPPGGRAVPGRPRSRADFRADRQRQQQLPHHLH